MVLFPFVPALSILGFFVLWCYTAALIMSVDDWSAEDVRDMLPDVPEEVGVVWVVSCLVWLGLACVFVCCLVWRLVLKLS